MKLIWIVLHLKLKELEEQEKITLQSEIKGGDIDKDVLSRSLSRVVPQAWGLAVEAVQYVGRLPIKILPIPDVVLTQIGVDAEVGLKRATMIYNARVAGLQKQSRVVDQAFSEYARACWFVVRRAIQDVKQYAIRRVFRG